MLTDREIMEAHRMAKNLEQADLMFALMPFADRAKLIKGRCQECGRWLDDSFCKCEEPR